MKSVVTASPHALTPVPPDIADLVTGWKLSLQATGRAPKTLLIYTGAVARMGRFLADRGMPVKIANVKREHIEAYLADLRELGYSPSTVNQQYRALSVFLGWCVEEGEVRKDRSPLANVHVPVPEPKELQVLTIEEVHRVIKTCAKGPVQLENRRDEAIVRLFFETGMRLGEMAGLRVDDVDLEGERLIVSGKGSGRGPRTRIIGFGGKTGKALYAYLRLRREHRLRALDALWLGRHETQPLGESGIGQMIAARGKLAGVDGVHPHALRATSAHHSLVGGMQESDLMKLNGWRSSDMVRRYTASAATERALLAQKRLGLGDRV